MAECVNEEAEADEPSSEVREELEKRINAINSGCSSPFLHLEDDVVHP